MTTRSLATSLLLLCSVAFTKTLQAADAVLVDASLEAVAGVLDVTASGTEITVSNIDSLTQITTTSGQSISLDGQELHTISENAETLQISGDAAIDIFNSGLTLPNDGTNPTVANLLALEFEGLAATKSLAPERLTVDGSHSNAIAALWIQLDQLYVGAGDFYNLEINTSFVYLGNDYARYLTGGNEARLDIVKIASDRLQTLHDNLLGNLGDSPIASRFTGLGEPDPRTAAGASFGERPYNRGTASADVYSDLELVSSVTAWDLLQGVQYPSVFTFPFAPFDAANSLSGTDSNDNLFGGGGDDDLNGGVGIDTVTYLGDVADYSLTGTASGFTIVDSVADRDGTDTVTNIEKAKFNDQTLLLVGGNDFTIQSAIDAADPGDTIVVAAGTYTEQLSIDKSLSLQGEQAGIDGRGRSSSESILVGNIVLNSTADDVVIDGFTFQEGGSVGGEKAAIFLATGASGTTIRNSIFTRSGEIDGDAFRGILTTSNGGNTDLVVTQNSFSGWATGVYLNPAATDAVISSNDFNGNFVGMSVDGPSNTSIANNTFSSNEFEGLGIGPGVGSPSLTLSGNDFSANETQIGVYTDITLDISANTFDNAAINTRNGFVHTTIQNAIDAASSGDTLNVLAGTYIEELSLNKQISLLGEQVGVDGRGRSGDESILMGNIVLEAEADDVVIDGFTLQEGASAGGEKAAVFLASGASNTTIQNNIFSRSGDVDGDTFRGILTTSSGGNTSLAITQNSFSGWATGVYLNPNATDAVVSNNDFEGNFVGMSVDGPDNTTITSNAFTNNGFEGLGIGPGNDDPSFTLTGNSFTNNTTHVGLYIDASIDLSANTFDTSVAFDSSSTPRFVVSVPTPDPVVVVPPPTPTPTPTPTPGEEISDSNDAIEEVINNIVIPDSGEEITEETIAAIDTVLDDVTTLADDTRTRIESGEITNDDALVVLDTLGDALGLAGGATNQGAAINEESVSESVESITNILNALDDEDPLEQTQVEQLQQVAEQAVDTVTNLIDEESSEDEVTALITDVEELLVSTENVGAGLDENIVAAAQALSQKALDNTIDDIANDIGVETTDPADVEATQTLLRENIQLLDRVLEVASVELPSSAELDTVALLDNLETNGLDSDAAGELSDNLSQFVNPVGVNLELTNGTSVNALDAMTDGVGGGTTTITVDDLTGSLLVDVGGTEIPVNVAKVAVVPPAVPEGVTVLPDGSALSVSDGVAVTIVPAPKDPIGLVSSLSPAVEDITLETNGGITITSGDGETFSGTFNFDDAQASSTGTVDEVTVNTPDSGDPSDPDYIFSVDYPDGSRQTIAPFVADDNFFDSLGTRGLTFDTSRSTGVVTVIDEATNSSSQFRPDYFVTPLTDEDQAFLDANGDQTGMAYRAVDVNGDGILDFESISAAGVQVIYGLP